MIFEKSIHHKLFVIDLYLNNKYVNRKLKKVITFIIK